MADTRTLKVKLDWSRLLGFEQAISNAGEADAIRPNDPRLARIGAKIGATPVN